LTKKKIAEGRGSGSWGEFNGNFLKFLEQQKLINFGRAMGWKLREKGDSSVHKCQGQADLTVKVLLGGGCE